MRWLKKRLPEEGDNNIIRCGGRKMNRWLSIKNWFVTQFKTHPLRSSLIASGIALALIAGSLLIFGIPRFGGLNLDQSGFDYLPDREYVLGAKEDERPQTLKELLYSQSPDIEDFLHSPNIAEELLAAENLVDIVDSRYALNNLREIDRQLEERTEEEDLPMGDLVTLHSSPIEKPPTEKPPGPEDALKPFMPDPAPVEERDPLPKSEGAKRLDQAAASIDFSRPGKAAQAQESYGLQQDLFRRLNIKVNHLLRLAEYGNGAHARFINMKGIWRNRRITDPYDSGGRLDPEAGYRIYRQIGSEKELIAENWPLRRWCSQNFQHPHAQDIQQAINQPNILRQTENLGNG